MGFIEKTISIWLKQQGKIFFIFEQGNETQYTCNLLDNAL